MLEIIPSFDFKTVFIDPWSIYFSNSMWVVLMGFLIASACGLIGNFIILKRMALMGDALGHSILPGIAIAFLLTSSRATTPLFIGALVVAFLTVVFIEFIHKNSLIKPDSAMGIVFSSLFALGVIIITLFADHIDLDTECVLYGELAFIPLAEPASIAGLNLGPYPVVRMAIVLIALIACISLFYKELLVSTFDPGLARCLRIKPRLFDLGITLTLSIVLVSAFKSVGAILVIAMLLFPGCTAMLISHNFKKILFLTILLAAFYSISGFHLATWLDCSIAAAMTVMAAILFSSIWAIKSIRNKMH